MKRTSSLLKDTVRSVAPFVAALLVFGGYALLCPYVTAQEPGPPPPPACAPDKPQGPPPPDAGAPDDPRRGDDMRGPGGPERGRPEPPPQDGPRGPRPGDDMRGTHRGDGRGPQGPGHRPMDPVQLFKDIDANGDGVITWNEFMDFHAQMRPQDGAGRRHREGPPADGKSDDRQGPPPPSDRSRGPRPGDDMRGPGGPEPGRPEPPFPPPDRPRGPRPGDDRQQGAPDGPRPPDGQQPPPTPTPPERPAQPR